MKYLSFKYLLTDTFSLFKDNEMENITIKFRALTPIWTGGVDRDCNRLHETGIIGSLRWWYEALIRGLGATACDPTNSKCEENKHCSACELFGCTGWARKFRLVVLDENGSIAQQIESGKSYTLQFIPLRHIHDEEVFLLVHTLKIISEIGSIGGKTVLKPPEVKSKNSKAHHADYGLIKIELNSSYKDKTFKRKQIEDFLKRFQKVHHDKNYPALTNFWFIQNYYISREKINSVVGRDENGKYIDKASQLQKWLGGDRGKSKKIFSFHSDKAKRTWGYAKDGELKTVIKLLLDILNKKNIKIERGGSLLKRIFNEGN